MDTPQRRGAPGRHGIVFPGRPIVPGVLQVEAGFIVRAILVVAGRTQGDVLGDQVLLAPHAAGHLDPLVRAQVNVDLAEQQVFLELLVVRALHRDERRAHAGVRDQAGDICEADVARRLDVLAGPAQSAD